MKAVFYGHQRFLLFSNNSSDFSFNILPQGNLIGNRRLTSRQRQRKTLSEVAKAGTREQNKA